MSSTSGLGEFEHLLLLALMQLKGRSYGTEIRNTLKTMIDRDTSIGALYTTLDRLDKKGLVCSSVGEPTASRGGRAKRYFEITAAGREALRAAKMRYDTMWQGVQLCQNK